jgi:hypothetical protein
MGACSKGARGDGGDRDTVREPGLVG